MLTVHQLHLVGRDFLTDQDFRREELLDLLAFARDVKVLARHGVRTPLLAGAHLGMLFEEPSTRTRAAFELSMRELGGDALVLRPGETHLGRRESIGDTARVLSRYTHAIGARLRHHHDLVELAEAASVPVVNGLTDIDHPVQTMSDALTIVERFGKVAGVRVTFLGGATSVCSSLALTMTQLGAHVTVANPPAYRLSDDVARTAIHDAADSGGSFRWTDNPVAAVAEADVVYTDAWPDGAEDGADARVAALAPFRVDAALMSEAPRHAVFMHRLPACRGREVTSEVIDSPQSIVFDQAENHLHFTKALLVALIGATPGVDFDSYRVAALASRAGFREV